MNNNKLSTETKQKDRCMVIKMEKSKVPLKKYIISVLISIIIVCIITGYLIKINSLDERGQYQAQSGVLNLRDLNLDKKNIIKLDGEWEFYPGVLLRPDEINKDIQNSYILVPGNWTSSLNEDKISADGSGTYRLIVKVPEDKIYAVKTNTIRTTARIYLNGQEASNMGNPSMLRNDFHRDSRFMIATSNSLNKEIEIIIHVSNYDLEVGGIIKSIEFGSFEAIMNYNSKSIVLDAITVSVCLTLCIFFLIIYLQQRNNIYLAYFSGINFFMAVYLSVFNEQILRFIFNYSYNVRTTIQIASLVIVTHCITEFVNHFFDNFDKRKIVDWITTLILLLSALCLYNPEKPIFVFLRSMHAVLLSVIMLRYAYTFYILIKEIYKRSELSEYILVITVLLVCYWVTMALKILFELSLGDISAGLILILTIIVAAMIGHRLQLDYQRAGLLSERLIRQDILKDEFLAKASNELKTPLHIIHNLTKKLLEGENGALNSKQQEALLYINREGQSLSRLVGDLLDSSRIKSGSISLKISSVNPHEAVEDIVNEIRALIPRASMVSMKNHIAAEFPPIKADPDKFRQIIYNLLHNALKFTKVGEIAVSAKMDGEFAEIIVSDTGIGIEKKYFNEIFDTFFQKNTGGESLGLGLSIVKNLVESQEGEISVHSVYGKGSNFKFRLPIYQDDKLFEETSADKTPVEASALKKREENMIDIQRATVLIVDKEPLNQKIILDIAESLELNTILTYSGSEALKAIESNKIDLIVMDLILSDIQGDKLCGIIRQNYSMTELPILILTASSRTNHLMNSFDYGANDFQRKPIDEEWLKSRILSLLLMKKSAEEGLEKEFQYFYSQISPHFLYNTLNTIIGLSYTDTGKVREALNNLSVYFRGKLDLHRIKGLVNLSSELEMVNAYLEIEKLRYGERLELEYDIEEDLHAMIPPLTLQPIIENAVKHGISVKPGGGKIKISAKKEDENLIKIVIEDKGVGMSEEKRQEILYGNNKRIGLKNVVEKIKIVKGSSFELETEIGKGTRVQILIPEAKYHESYFS